MLIKRFTAPTIHQALQKVKKELGEDAVILRSRPVKRRGWFSFGRGTEMEVIAATPDASLLSSGSKPPDPRGVEEIWRRREAVLQWSQIKEEIGEIKEQMRMLVAQVNREQLPLVSPQLSRCYQRLVQSGVDGTLAAELIEAVSHRSPGEFLGQNGGGGDVMREEIEERIRVKIIDPSSGPRPLVIALVGPTGVGKTTTLAKLVTSYRFWGKSRVALISADTYRVAALEQLKTFAAIAGLPVEAVYQPRAMVPALLRHQTKDAIFIDTAGRSPSERDKIEELSQFLSQAQPREVLLCLSATTGSEDLLAAVERYKPLGLSGIIVTKLDETLRPGHILNLAMRVDLPLTFVTVGQNVPDDIFYAERGLLAKVVMNGEYLLNLQRSRFAEWRRSGLEH